MNRLVKMVGLWAALAGVAMAGAATAAAATATSGADAASNKRQATQLAPGPLAASDAVAAGYLVVHSGDLTAANGTHTRGSIDCPPTSAGVIRQPLGGGALVTSTSTGANVHGSYPKNISWVVDINNTSGADTTFSVYAVCAEQRAEYTVVTKRIANPAGSQTEGFKTCPAGTRVTGGGGMSSSGDVAVNINTSSPTSNGWRIDMNNASGSDTTFRVYAICTTYSGTVRYSLVTGVAVDNPAGSQTAASVACYLGESPLGGGGFSSSGDISVNLNTSFPAGGGWQVFQNNASTTDASITAYVVCAF